MTSEWTAERRREIEDWMLQLRKPGVLTHMRSSYAITDCLAEIDRLNGLIEGMANTITALANDDDSYTPQGKVVGTMTCTFTPTAAVIAAQENIE